MQSYASQVDTAPCGFVRSHLLARKLGNIFVEHGEYDLADSRDSRGIVKDEALRLLQDARAQHVIRARRSSAKNPLFGGFFADERRYSIS